MVRNARDYNGDGNSDILLRSNSGDVAIWLLNGTRVSEARVAGALRSGSSIEEPNGDFNGDGKSDLLLRNSTNGELTIWQMNGTHIEISIQR